MIFTVGQTVSHSSHGIGKIKAIEARTFSDKTSDFYIIEIMDQGVPKKVFVPVDKAAERLSPVPERDWTDAGKAQFEALESLNAAILAQSKCEGTAYQEAQRVRELIETGHVFTEAELTDYLHQAAIDFDGNVRPAFRNSEHVARKALAELTEIFGREGDK